MKCKNSLCQFYHTAIEDQATGTCGKLVDVYGTEEVGGAPVVVGQEAAEITLSETGTCEQMILIPFEAPTAEYAEYMDQFKKMNEIEGQLEETLPEDQKQLAHDLAYELTR